MLYKKNYLSTLSDELFRSPTSEYRAAPFWAWNCKLEEKELLRQIDVFHRMGFGGFHMHVRTGMDTEYLSDEFMQLIRACTDKAKGEKMLAWLYDEDRWPSGAAGGIVTRISASAPATCFLPLTRITVLPVLPTTRRRAACALRTENCSRAMT